MVFVFIVLRSTKSSWLMLYFYFLQVGLALKLYSQILKYVWPLIWLRGRIVSKAEVAATHDPSPPTPLAPSVSGYSGDLVSEIVRYSDHGTMFDHWQARYSDHQNMVVLGSATWITNHLNNKQVKVLIHMSCYTDPHCITQNTTCVLIGKDTRNLRNNRLQNCAAIYWPIFLSDYLTNNCH